jgi:RNA polymerase sigma factor (sigma-70 family)
VRAERLDLDTVDLATETDDELLLRIDEALLKLAIDEPRCAELVKLRFFVGLGYEEIAQSMGISTRTAKRNWDFARTWLYRELSRSGSI